MPFSFNIAAEDGQLAKTLDEFVRVFNARSSLVASEHIRAQSGPDPSGGASAGPGPATETSAAIPTGEQAERRKRRTKAEIVADEAAKNVDATVEKILASGGTASTESAPTTEAVQAVVPDIEAVRAALKSLGAAEGHGHDKVFEVLGKYGAKNASTVPEVKRAELIGEINGMLAAKVEATD